MMDRNFFATRSTDITAKAEVICVNLSHHGCLLETESLLLLLLFVQHEKLKISESVETNMEDESDLTLDALPAKTPFALRSGRTWTGLSSERTHRTIILARRLSRETASLTA
jgi:hypothetical protein